VPTRRSSDLPGTQPRARRLSSKNLAVLPVFDQFIDHTRISERRGIAQRAELILGHLAQNAAHDLARAGLGQARRPLEQVRRGDRADLLAHPGLELGLERIVAHFAFHQADIAINALPLDVVRVADHSRFADLGMADQRAFDFGCAHAVAGYVDHVIDATGDPQIAILVAAAAVATEIIALIG